jgi:anaerobic ribonucleoside-triphosphate reductase activating protein
MWELARELDAIIEGEFILALRDISLKFRGSSNQRLLRLKDGEIVSIE